MQSCLGVRTSSEFNQDENVESYSAGNVILRMRLMLNLCAIFVFWHKSFVLDVGCSPEYIFVQKRAGTLG